MIVDVVPLVQGSFMVQVSKSAMSSVSMSRIFRTLTFLHRYLTEIDEICFAIVDVSFRAVISRVPPIIT